MCVRYVLSPSVYRIVMPHWDSAPLTIATCRMSLTITSLTRNQTVISLFIPWFWGRVAKPLRSKSAPNRCMKMQSWVLLRTGKYKEGAAAGGARSGHEDRIAWLRKLIAWQEEMADSGEMLDEVRSQSLTTECTSLRRKVMSLICLRDQRRWTSLTTSTVMSDTAASGKNWRAHCAVHLPAADGRPD